MLTFADFVIALFYMGGYALVAYHSFEENKSHCWAYSVLTGAAGGHVSLILLRWRRKKKRDQKRHPTASNKNKPTTPRPVR